MSDLKNCPFCGCPARLIFGREYWGFDTFKIVCEGDMCKMQTPEWQNKDDAIKSWNRRVSDE
jgi:Lar family restriction alleviation protein